MNFNKKLATAVSGAVLLMAGQFALADSTTDIVDALVSKGVLTEEEGKLISKGHESKKKAEGTVGFKDGFKFSSGDGKSTISLAGRIQADYRYFDAPAAGSGGGLNPNGADTFDIRRAYLGVKGTFRGWINYEATYDAAGDKGSNMAGKYIWLEPAFSDSFKVRFGQFKMPFGLEQLTSSRFIDFTERDWAASFAPAVNKGIMVHGAPIAGLTYAVSVSNGGLLADTGSGDVKETGSGNDGKSYNARVTANVAQFLGYKEAIGHIGAAYGFDDSLPNIAVAGLSLRSNARGSTFFSNSTAMNNPDINRYGLEAIASYGPVKFQGEYAKMDIEFTQVAAPSDIRNQKMEAGYAGVSWMITGESYADSYKNGVMDRMSPKNNYTGLASNGWGAWEIGARYSKFNAQDVAVTAGQFVNQAHSYSVGLKWIVDPNTRFLMDYIYTDYQDKNINYNVLGVATRAGEGGADNEKAVNFRAHFDF